MPTDDAPLDSATLTLAAAASRDVKLPTFCATDAVSWFQRAEIQFRLKRVTASDRKADYVLAALPEDIFPHITDWLSDQGSSTLCYDDVKKQLLRKFVSTPEERADQLLTLSRRPLGDQRPSIAFREMKMLTRVPADDGTNKALDLLRILWLLRLPDDVRRGITNFSDISEDELTKLADSLQGANRGAASRPAMSAAKDEGSVTSNDDDPRDDTAAAAHTQRKHWGQPRPQPPRGPPPRKADPPGLCFYHSRFGHDARNCRLPCSWTKNL